MKKKIYIGFLLSYLLIFLIPILMNINTQNHLMSILIQNVSESRLHTLKQYVTLMDRHFEELDDVFSKITVNNTLRYLSYRTSPKQDPTIITSILSAENFVRENRYNGISDEYFVYLKNPGILVSQKYSFLDENAFFSRYFEYTETKSQEDYLHLFGNVIYNKALLPSANIRIGSYYDDYILYLQSFPLASAPAGTFFVPIKVSDIMEVLSESDVPGSFIYIADSYGNILLNTSTYDDTVLKKLSGALDGKQFLNTDVNEEKMLVMQVKSQYNNMAYTSVIPQSFIDSQLEGVRSRLFFIMLAALLVGTVLLLAMVYINGKPLSDTLVMINTNTGAEGFKFMNMSYISKSVARLIDSNKNLRLHIELQKPHMKRFLVEQLLKGSFKPNETEETLRASLENLDMKPLTAEFAAVVFFIDIPDEQLELVQVNEFMAIKELVKSEIMSLFNNSDYFYDIDSAKSACIISKSAYEGDLEAVLTALSHTLGTKLKTSVIFFVGSFCRDWLKLPKSYDEALEAFNHRPYYSEKHVWFYSEDYKADEYFYPTNMEERLINAVRLGDRELVSDQLRRIYKKNIISRGLSSIMTQYLLYELEGTLIKALQSINYEEADTHSLQREIFELHKAGGFLEQFQRLTLFYGKACDLVQESKQMKSSQTINQIIKYIEENHEDPNLSLSTIAEKFHFTSAYLSALFKRSDGTNFSSRLEKIRIDHVCRLLEEGKTLEVIASATGYNSVHVMRNAFKRTMGMNPNEYRAQARSKP